MKARRAEAFWVESRSRWQINVQRDGLRKTFVSSEKGKRGKHDAEARADKWLAQFTSEQTISDALDIFMEDKKERVSERTYIQYKYTIDGHIRTAFPPKKKLGTITEYDWQTVIYNSQMKKASSQRLLISLISSFVKYARSRRWDIEPVDFLKVRNDAQESAQKKSLTISQIRALFSHDADDLPHVDFFRLAVLTGCRKSELINLRWFDVGSDSLHIEKGKTKNARRTVPLITQAAEILNRLPRQFEYVFPNPHGGTYSATAIDYSWKKVSTAIGADDVNIHELRHTYVSICKGEMPTMLLKQAIGHSASMDTFGVYGHETEIDISDAISASQTAFDRVFKQ